MQEAGLAQVHSLQGKTVLSLPEGAGWVAPQLATSGLHRFSGGLLLLSRMGTGLVREAGSPRDSQDAACSPTISGQGYAPLP